MNIASFFKHLEATKEKVIRKRRVEFFPSFFPLFEKKSRYNYFLMRYCRLEWERWTAEKEKKVQEQPLIQSNEQTKLPFFFFGCC